MQTANTIEELPDNSFTLSLQRGAATNKVNRNTFTIDSLAHYITHSPPVSEKLDSRSVIGAMFTDNIRSGANLLRCTALTLDFDKPLNETHLQDACEMLNMFGVAYVGFNSYSNHGKFALIIPFDRPTDRAGSARALKEIQSILGGLGGFASESAVQEQLRFISPNPNHVRKVISSPSTASLFSVAPAGNIVTPITSNAGKIDKFELLSEASSPLHRELYLEALRHDCIDLKRVNSYLEWVPLVFATFRAFNVTSEKLTQEQQGAFEVLEAWCKAHDGYAEGSLKAKLKDYVRNPSNGKPLHISSILTHEVDAFKLREHLDFDLLEAFNKLKPMVVIDPVAIAQATTERDDAAMALAAQRMRAYTSLQRLPAHTAHAKEFKRLVISLATQGKDTSDTLSPDDWTHFFHPVPILLGMMQIAAAGFTNVLFQFSPKVEAKALNIYALNIAKAASGKSATVSMLKNIMDTTHLKACHSSAKYFSDTAMWVNTFQHCPLLVFFNEEAEAFFGKAGQIDQNRAGLHTMMKTLYDQGLPGKTFAPNSQVKQQIKEVMSPYLAINLAGTPTLLNTDISDHIFKDGLLSRMLVNIDTRQITAETEEAEIARYAELVLADKDEDYNKVTHQAGEMFCRIWSDGGNAAYSNELEKEDLHAAIGKTFSERTMETARIMTIAPDDAKEVSAIVVKSKRKWVIPAGADADMEANISSLRDRCQTKIYTLAAIMTLIANPKAVHFDVEYLRWASEFQYDTEHEFYQFMFTKANSFTLLNKYQLDTSNLDKLKSALGQDGPLGKGECSAAALYDYNYPWKKLITGLRHGEDSPLYKAAKLLLAELNVSYKKVEGVKGLRFFRTD